MALDQTADLPIESARAMLSHLRQFPADAAKPPREIAEQFNLPEAFVQSVLINATRPAHDEDLGINRRIRFDWPARAYAKIRSAIASIVLKPFWLVVVSDLALVGLLLYFARFVPDTAKIGVVPVDALGMVGAIFLTFLTQAICFYRNRSILLPIQAGFLNWFSLCSFVTVSMLVQNPGVSYTLAAIVSVWVGLFMLFIATTGVGIVIALMGGWAYERSLERRENSLTRQEQLERFFELQNRLENGSRGQRAYHWLEQSAIARLLRQRPILTVVGFWALMELPLMTIGSPTSSAGLRTSSQNASPETQLSGLLLAVGIAVLSLLGMTLIGFLSRNVLKALGLGALGGITTIAVQLIPIGGYGVKHVIAISNLIPNLLGLAAIVIFSGFAGLAGELNERAALRGNVDRNDPAAIMAEMLRIQWRLSEGKQNVCVLVIDAAKSSRMKAEADPLDAEYSFRLYQEWIARICHQFSGKVHSTAGDGAVVAFATCEKAFAAAKRLQTDVVRFNREENILTLPFQLRIGLHHGAVSAQIDEVEFTEVIDIAAHVEGRATVGGIAVTNDVIDVLDPAQFIPMAEEVDGKQIYLARNPKES
jgi:class 3 adenylate cyclase